MDEWMGRSCLQGEFLRVFFVTILSQQYLWAKSQWALVSLGNQIRERW